MGVLEVRLTDSRNFGRNHYARSEVHDNFTASCQSIITGSREAGKGTAETKVIFEARAGAVELMPYRSTDGLVPK